MTEKSRRLYERLVRHGVIFKTELQKAMDRMRRRMKR
jgi:hypothetical protein